MAVVPVARYLLPGSPYLDVRESGEYCRAYILTSFMLEGGYCLLSTVSFCVFCPSTF